MTVKTVNGAEELRALVGTHVGYSDWRVITQERVNLFADATDDHQWIHVDPERAARGPFGGPIAHGFLTLSLTLAFLPEILAVEGFSMVVNYGLNRVRFPAPVPVGAKIRGGLAIDSLDEVAGGVQLVQAITVEADGSAKPGCVAELIGRYYL
jgi:acyl dehydratase